MSNFPFPGGSSVTTLKTGWKESVPDQPACKSVKEFDAPVSAQSKFNAFCAALNSTADNHGLMTNFCIDEYGCAIATGLIWQEETCEWCEIAKQVGVIPQFYKAGETPPTFNGTAEVCLADGGTAEVEGCKPLPEDMTGSLMFNGKDEDGKPKDPCFMSGKVVIPDFPDFPAIPNEVQCGGAEPTDPDVELWITNGVSKTKNADGIWVQV